jgi:hypothetical protein
MTVRAALVAAGAMVLLSGCGTDGSGGAAETSAASAVQTTPATPAPQAEQPAGPSLDITIAGGAVTPVNAELEARIGEPITLNVTSDAADELHVHAVPEATFEVAPAADQSFEFTVDVPGRVEVELHELHRTVVTIQVRP